MTTPTPIYTAPASSVRVSDFRTQQGEPSYLDITVLSGPSFGPVGTVFDGWCLDTRVALDSPANYVVSAYSTYELTTLASTMPTLGNPGGFISNLDSINWLMGYYNPTTAQTYTYGDVQAAIWTMMGQDWHLGQDAALGAVDQTRITTLVNLALAHDGYVPDVGEAIGIVLDPVNANGVHGQPIIIETKAATYRILVQPGISAAQQNVGTNDAIDSDVNYVGLSDAVTLKSGEVNLTVDAGFWTTFFSPLVLDLDGSGKIETTTLASSGGAFDLLGTGHAIHSGWITGGDGFLAVDSNGNGRIDGIGELFGGSQLGVGYAKLASFDSNGDGLVDQRDANLGQLMIWRDANGNHQTDAGELVTLAQAGVSSLVVEHTNTLTVDAQGNGLGETSSASLANGSSVTMTDVYFAVSPDDAKAAGAPSVADLLSDDHALDAVLGQSAAAPVQLPAADVPVDGLGEAAELIRRITSVSHDHVPFAVV